MTTRTFMAEDSRRVLAVAEVGGWVYGADLASLVTRDFHVYYYILTAHILLPPIKPDSLHLD